MKEGSIPLFEFHISRKARDLYGFDQSLFSTRGHIVFANFHAARQFAQKINARRDLLNFPERAVQAGQINALGMIDEILHHVIFLYTEQVNPRVRSDALAHLDEQFGVEVVDTVLAGFTDEFPSLAEYRRQVNLSDTNEGTAFSQETSFFDDIWVMASRQLVDKGITPGTDFGSSNRKDFEILLQIIDRTIETCIALFAG